MSCAVTMQYGRTRTHAWCSWRRRRLFDIARTSRMPSSWPTMRPSREVRSGFLEVCEYIMDKLDEIWYKWSRKDDAGQVHMWQQVEEYVTMRSVQCPQVTMTSKYTKTSSPLSKATGGRSALQTTWPVSRLNIARASDRQWLRRIGADQWPTWLKRQVLESEDTWVTWWRKLPLTFSCRD